MSVRGLRGATTVDHNTQTAILNGTRELLETLLADNQIALDDIASIFFSATPDLNAEFPAKAARQMGMMYTPLLCLNEMPIPDSLSRCIRVLILVNTSKSQAELKPVYLRKAVVLRQDIPFA